MPTIPPSVAGYTSLNQQVRLCLEPTAGEQLLLSQTAAAATMSLTTQPNTLSPTTGMALHFYVIGNATTGTITIAGTAPGTGSAVNSQTYHVPIAPQNSQGYTEFTTKEVFATVNASGITTTGLSSAAQIIVYGSYAGKYLIPVTMDAEEKVPKFSPNDKRGILFKNLRVSQLTKGAALDKFDAALYPDSLWAPYMLIGNSPTITTLPGTPTSLLASTARAATMTLTTAPTAPGMFLIFTITSNTASGTIALSGTDQYGNAVSETITVSSTASQTLYSTKRYSALTSPGTNQFTTTGMTGASIAVTGVFAWVYTWTYDGVNNVTPYSACLELFDGVMGLKLPYAFFTEGTWDWQKQKEIMFQAKGEAQDYLIVGDNSPTTYPSGINPFGTLSQPTSMPVVSWPSQFFIDAGTGTPLTTQDGSLLTFKVKISTGRKPFWSGDGMQRWSNVTWDSEPNYELDASIVFQNYYYYTSFFKTNTAMLIGAEFDGAWLCTIGGTPYYENWTWILPAKIESFKPDHSKNPVEGTLKLMSEYNFTQGYAYKLAVTAQVPPTYTS